MTTMMMDVSTDNRTNVLQSKMEDINKNILNSLSEENAALQKEEHELQLLHNNNNKVLSSEQREVDATDAINHIQTDKYRRQISDCTVHISNIAATSTLDTSSNDQQDNSLALTGLTSYDNTIRRGRLNSSDDTTTTSSDTCISINPEVSSHMSTLTPASPLTISASTFNDSAISNISIEKQDGVVSYDDLVLSMMRNEEPVVALHDEEGEIEQKKKVVTVSNKQSEEKRRLPARRLSRNNSAKGGSFRGSLKNVLENAPLDEDDNDNNDSPHNLTKTHEQLVDNMDSLPKRGITRSNSGRGGSFRFRKGDNKLPMRYLPRSSSAKGASFRGIPETRPDDSSSSLTSQELVQTLQSQEDILQARINEMENLILSGGSVSSSRSHPPTGSILQSIAASSSYDTSFRSNLMESIHLYNSSSSLSSASTLHTSGIDCSINLMDFGVSHSRFSVDSSETTTSTSAADNNDDGTTSSTPSQISIVSTLSGNRTNSSRSLLSSNKTNSARSLLSDSDGFIGWGQSRDSKKVTPTRGRKTLSKQKGSTIPMRGVTREESNLSNLSDLVDSEGFLKWESKRDLGSFDTSSPSMTKEERKEEETTDAVSDLKEAGNLVKQFKRLSSNLTASIKRSSWEINNDNTSRPLRNSTGTIPRRSSDIPDMNIRRSTGNNDRPNRRSSLFNSVFSRRKSNAGDDNSSEDDEYYTQNIRPRVKREDSEACIDIGELRRELCEAAEEGTDKGNNLNRKLKNVIF